MVRPGRFIRVRGFERFCSPRPKEEGEEHGEHRDEESQQQPRRFTGLRLLRIANRISSRSEIWVIHTIQRWTPTCDFLFMGFCLLSVIKVRISARLEEVVVVLGKASELPSGTEQSGLGVRRLHLCDEQRRRRFSLGRRPKLILRSPVRMVENYHRLH